MTSVLTPNPMIVLAHDFDSFLVGCTGLLVFGLATFLLLCCGVVELRRSLRSWRNVIRLVLFAAIVAMLPYYAILVGLHDSNLVGIQCLVLANYLSAMAFFLFAARSTRVLSPSTIRFAVDIGCALLALLYTVMVVIILIRGVIQLVKTGPSSDPEGSQLVLQVICIVEFIASIACVVVNSFIIGILCVEDKNLSDAAQRNLHHVRVVLSSFLLLGIIRVLGCVLPTTITQLVGQNSWRGAISILYHMLALWVPQLGITCGVLVTFKEHTSILKGLIGWPSSFVHNSGSITASELNSEFATDYSNSTNDSLLPNGRAGRKKHVHFRLSRNEAFSATKEYEPPSVGDEMIAPVDSLDDPPLQDEEDLRPRRYRSSGDGESARETSCRIA